jgi:hypothetical protein
MGVQMVATPEVPGTARKSDSEPAAAIDHLAETAMF